MDCSVRTVDSSFKGLQGFGMECDPGYRIQFGTIIRIDQSSQQDDGDRFQFIILFNGGT
ncbi:MAG: hypothetical protein KBA26_00695 [Candidatus Delongbacteria bacterium]|nr:hypothetical protein [Candidatus Delongbacteria bacterium]